MAKKRQHGDPSSTQGVLISLSICIPLIIGLSTATYFGFAGQKEREDKAAAAIQERDKANKARALAEDEVALLKAFIGLPLDKNEETAFVTFHDHGQPPNSDQGVLHIIKELNKDPGWDAVKRAPKDTFRNQIADLKNKLQTAEKKYDTFRNESNKAWAKLDADLRTNRKAVSDQAEMLKRIEDRKEENEEKLLGNFTKAQQENNRLRDEIDDHKKKAGLQRGELQAVISKLGAEKKTLEKKNDVLQIKIAPVYLPDYEQPKGKIDAIDPEGRFAYINIGTVESVNPLLTFSVYSPGPDSGVDLYRAEGNQVERDRKRAAHVPLPKGTLEVVSILGPHSAKARITGVRDLNRDPLVPGDLIFNPIWDPNQHMHVAVTGMINLTGDGRDRSAEFIHNLQRMGVIIDSYLDTNDLKVKGPGITVKTNYLVEGEHPEVNNMLVLAGSSIGERSTKIDELINQMKNQAKDLGISTMTARNFMTLVGYRLPKQIIPFAGPIGYGTLGGSSKIKEEGKD